METIALLFLFGIFIILSYTLGLKKWSKVKERRRNKNTRN